MTLAMLNSMPAWQGERTEKWEDDGIWRPPCAYSPFLDALHPSTGNTPPQTLPEIHRTGFILWVNQYLELLFFHIAVRERDERKFIWIVWIAWTYLFHFGESQVQSGVHPCKNLVPSHKVRRIHHPYVWCPHLFFFSPSEKTAQKQSRQIQSLPHKLPSRDHQQKCRSTQKPFQTVKI